MPAGASVPSGASVPAAAGRRFGGRTTIADPVVAKLAAGAAREVDGVVSLGGTISGALSGVVGLLRGDEHRTAGVSVEVGQVQTAVDLTLALRYPSPVTQITEQVRALVVERIQTLTGLQVAEVNISVGELVLDSSPEEPAAGRVA